MLHRKIEQTILDYLKNGSNKIMVVDGARQIGKTFIIRYVATELLSDVFPNYIEINFIEDSLKNRYFEHVGSIDDFYLVLSTLYGERMKERGNTLIFIDEIQQYPQFLTMLKFLKQDDRFTYICSGSLLGVTLMKTPSLPIGSIDLVHMYPLDFEEFLLANGFNSFAIDALRQRFAEQKSVEELIHNRVMELFRKYLIVGGMPDAVNSFTKSKNVVGLRKIQNDIIDYYGDDASKYDRDHKLKIKRIYDLIPSNLGNKKKRVVVKDIDKRAGARYSFYEDEFDYLVSSGIALEVKAISNPSFPLIESASKNLLKLYLNDVGLLSNVLYKNNVNAILSDERSVNLGSVYESFVASELFAHGHRLFYYDNKANGEVDFLIDDYDNLSILPIEVKSGKDYTVHSAINRLLSSGSYNVKKGFVLSNNAITRQESGIVYMPIYMAMFL